MRDIIVRVLKVQNVIKIVTFISSIITTASAQQGNHSFITEEEYKIINAIFTFHSKEKILVYKDTYFDKGWVLYFNPQNFPLITERVGIPTIISDAELKELLTDNVLSEIRNNIYAMKPISLDKKNLMKSIKLVNFCNGSLGVKKDVVRISKPIIINNIAVFRRIGANEAPIFILRKYNDTWKIVYTFYDWLILNE